MTVREVNGRRKGVRRGGEVLDRKENISFANGISTVFISYNQLLERGI